MNNRPIYITDFDLKRLKKLITARQRYKYSRQDLLVLEIELNRGIVVHPHEVPAEVITLNSTACLVDLDTGEELSYMLVYPEGADLWEGKISVLAPMGIAMLGYRVGDIFEWQVPDGIRRFKVKALLYQPEAAGDYHLQ